MRLGLHKEDLFALLLHHWQLHHSTDVTTIKVAEKLYLTPHEPMHWHEGRLLGGTEPADQLVADIGEPDDCLKVIPDALVKVRLRTVCIGGALSGNNTCLFGKTYILKTLTHQVEQGWTIVHLSF
jgi:hypothetical protein